ncbi:helix-turn-helix domain-containing protein [Streptomyces sp. NPDC059618]|uniref:helix-turn-helix domain-containing protein n=1 Tax=Streptomyces sp. NPDC059618 TaxID=3346887 RepID=UPI003690EB4A
MTRSQGVGGGEPSGREALAAELRRLKERSGLSFGRLAGKTHYSRSSWERFLNGKQLPTAVALEEFAAVMEADADFLLGLLEGAQETTGSGGEAQAQGVSPGATARATTPAPATAPAPAPARTTEPSAEPEAAQHTLVRPAVPDVVVPAGAVPTRPAPAQAVAAQVVAAQAAGAQPASVQPVSVQPGFVQPGFVSAPSVEVPSAPTPPAEPEPPSPAARDWKPGVKMAGLVAAGALLGSLATTFALGAGPFGGSPGTADPTPKTPRPGCSKDSCQRRDPQAMDCQWDATTARETWLRGMHIELRYSAACGAVWGRIESGAVGDSVTIKDKYALELSATVRVDRDTYTGMLPVDSAAPPRTVTICGRIPKYHAMECSPEGSVEP